MNKRLKRIQRGLNAAWKEYPKKRTKPSKFKVSRFWLQPTTSFPDGAPQREVYEDDEAFEAACSIYRVEWRNEYECGNADCFDSNCPQHFPGRAKP